MASGFYSNPQITEATRQWSKHFLERALRDMVVPTDTHRLLAAGAIVSDGLEPRSRTEIADRFAAVLAAFEKKIRDDLQCDPGRFANCSDCGTELVTSAIQCARCSGVAPIE